MSTALRTVLRRAQFCDRSGTRWVITVSAGVAGTHCLGLSCPFRQLFGLDCPGCGGTRAVTALLHGQLTEAVHDNAMLLLIVLIGVGTAIWRPGGLPALLAEGSARRRIAAVLIVLGWTVLRNLPQFSWLNADRGHR